MKLISRLDNICGEQTTSNLQMPYKVSLTAFLMLLDRKPGSVRSWLSKKILEQFIAHSFIKILLSVFDCCFIIFHLKTTLYGHLSTSMPMRADLRECIMKCSLEIIGGISMQNFHLERLLCLSFVVQTKLFWQLWLETTVHGWYTSLSATCQNMSDRSLLVMQFFSLPCYPNFHKVIRHQTLTKGFIKHSPQFLHRSKMPIP